MLETVFALLEDLFERDDFSPLTRFSDLGADQEDLYELFFMIEEEFDIRTDPKDAASIVTVGDLCRYIESRQK